MDDATWDSLFKHLPEIILAICTAIIVIYKDIKGTKAIKENTQITKDSVDEINKAKESMAVLTDKANILADEAKEIASKQKESSDEMLRVMQEKLKESDARITELMKEKEKKDC